MRTGNEDIVFPGTTKIMNMTCFLFDCLLFFSYRKIWAVVKNSHTGQRHMFHILVYKVHVESLSLTHLRKWGRGERWVLLSRLLWIFVDESMCIHTPRIYLHTHTVNLPAYVQWGITPTCWCVAITKWWSTLAHFCGKVHKTNNFTKRKKITHSVVHPCAKSTTV